MTSEVLHLHIGSGGIDIGNHCWELYCLEHNLDVDECTLSKQNPPQCFFSELNDDIKTSKSRNFFSDDQFLLG